MDYLIAPNKFSSDIFRRCFIYDKVMLETGYPRNDILHYENKEELAWQIKKRIGVPWTRRLFCMRPRRDDEYYTKDSTSSPQAGFETYETDAGLEYVICCGHIIL